MISASTLALADERVDGLIRDLANPDPTIREKASSDLIAIGEPAREKLAAAAKSPRPAIATAAAAALAKLPWDRPGDSAPVANVLKLYGNANEDNRVGILLNLLANLNAAPDAPAAVLRVLGEEPSPRVTWTVALRVDPNASDAWQKAIDRVNPDHAPAAVKLVLATHQVATNALNAQSALHDALVEARDGLASVDANTLLSVYNLAARNDLHGDAAWVLEQLLLAAGGEEFVINRGDAKANWPNAEMVARAKWHRFKDAESRKDDPAMKQLAIDLLEMSSSDMSIFLDVLPTLEKSADAVKVDEYFNRAYEEQKARIEEQPEEPVHKNDLAWLLARSGRKLAEAEPLAEAAVKARPNEAAYLDTLAEVKFRLGKINEAVALEEKALQNLPGDKFMTEQLQRFKAALPTTRPAN